MKIFAGVQAGDEQSGAEIFVRFCLLFALAFVEFLAVACAPKREIHSSHDAIYNRAQLHFTNAVLFKPEESGLTNELGFKLAPLVFREIIHTNDSLLPLEIFFSESNVTFNGKVHSQVTYAWFTTTNSAARPVAQGIRITTDANGLPVVWEVLRDSSDLKIFYVSEGLEALAKLAGDVLPDRRFAIEADPKDFPNSIVARVISDSPAVMGPMIYLFASSPDVGTVACRCMPTQVSNLFDTRIYKLLPATETNDPALRELFNQPGALASLRLPPDF